MLLSMCFIRVFRIFRKFRVIRIFRFFRSFRDDAYFLISSNIFLKRAFSSFSDSISLR